MDDLTSIPFEFEDCDAFLASLNESSSQQQQQQSQTMNNTTNNNKSMSNVDLDLWNIPLSPQTAGESNNYIISPQDLDNTFTAQSNSSNPLFNYDNNSSASSPISSPGMSIHSISDSDTTGNFMPESLMFSGVDTSQFSLPNENTIGNYPVTPPYPSASSTGSSSALPDDFAFSPLPAKNKTTSNSGAADTAKRGNSKVSAAPPKTKASKVTKPKKEKTSHNMIEKRYRTNINDKILALRDCVPSLRCVISGDYSADEDLEGLTPASKLNKATVLTKATEYILHLQKRNNLLMKELQAARRSEGLGEAPVRTSSAYPATNQKSKVASKAMMLSMAGLMGAGLMNENSDMQGLSALPIFSFLASSPFDAHSVLFALKVALIAGTVLYIFAPTLFDSPSPKSEKAQLGEIVNTTQEHSPKDVRRQTWLTNTRSLALSSENISSQTLAFVKTLASVLVVSLMGADGYEFVARSLDRQPLSLKRITLARAIDAQLCGGDDKVTRGRLFYTFVQTFLLAPSAGRYLSQAVHVSVLCNGNSMLELLVSHVAKYFWSQARKAAATERPVSEEDATPTHIRELLNTYTHDPVMCQRLANLTYGRPISIGCSSGSEDEGFSSIVTDKAIRTIGDAVAALYANTLVHKVLVNVLESDEIDFRTLENCEAMAPPCSIVSRRVAIAEALLLGPKDASFAKNAMEMLKDELSHQAWFSQTLKNATIIQDAEEEDSSSDDALSISDASISDTSILTERPSTVAELSFLSSAATTPTVTAAPYAVSQDSRLGIRCALILCYVSRNLTLHAHALLHNAEINKAEHIGLLGFVAMWKVLREMYDDRKSAANGANAASRAKLEELAAVARVWLGGSAAAKEGVEIQRLRELVGESVEMSKFFGGFGVDGELDEGYATQ